MKIQDPVLVVDVSDWCDHINTNELEDGGVESVIVGLYDEIRSGAKVLSRKSRQHCEAVAKSNLVLQAYLWDDITLPPAAQANWYCDMMDVEGLPVKFAWADQEMWWASWTPWWAAQKSHDYSKVPVANRKMISQHNHSFMATLHGRLSASGVYTNKGFIGSWAPGMDAWLPEYLSWVPQYGHQPTVKTKMTWAQFRANWMPDYNIILSSGQLLQNVRGHQFTGERCLLPGSYNYWDGKIPLYDGRLPMDVSVFERSFIDTLRGGTIPPTPEPPSPIPDGSYRVTSATLKVFTGPGDTFRQSRQSPLKFGQAVVVVEIVDARGEQWARIETPAGWVRLNYLTKTGVSNG
jgi:hypothetical protein